MYYISHTVHMFLARHTGIKCTISFLEIQRINIQKHQHFPLDCAVIQYPFFPCSSWNYINTWRIQPKDHLNNRKWYVFPGTSNRSTNRKSKQLNKFSVWRPLRHPSSSTPNTSMDNWIALRNIWIHSHILRTRFSSMHTTCIGQMQRYQPAGSSPLPFSLVDLKNLSNTCTALFVLSDKLKALAFIKYQYSNSYDPKISFEKCYLDDEPN